MKKCQGEKRGKESISWKKNKKRERENMYVYPSHIQPQKKQIAEGGSSGKSKRQCV
jgi:hypothetical protein